MRLGIRSIPITGAPVNGTNEQQTITLSGTPTGGTYKLKFKGLITSVTIAYDATAAVVQAALEGIGSIGSGGCTVTGNAEGPYTVEFTGNLGKLAISDLLVLSSNALTGGTDPSVVLAESVEGVTATQRGSVLGTTLIDLANGKFYQNIGTSLAPIWNKANSPLSDLGLVPDNSLRVDADVVEDQTVTIGDDIYEVEIVNTDTTDDTQGDDFVPVTNPLVVADFVTNYPNTTVAVGLLIGIQNEIMLMTSVDGDDVTFARGVSGTTIATHADAENVLEGDGVTAGNIAVGLVATLTPTAFTAALTDDINNRGTENVTAQNDNVNEVYVFGSDEPGGDAAASTSVLATTETLAGANNEWATATLTGGRAEGQRSGSMFIHTVDAVEVALGEHRITFPFDILTFITQAYTSAGVPKNNLTDQIVIENGNQLVWDGTGAINPAAGDTLHGLVWGN